MKNEILERAMFAMPLSKDARNSGIMAGFEEDMPEDMEDEGMEEMPPMARTPQNPEILMNTLRGDMRSLDARYQELAQMVGEDAAMETPPEVLAMLQPQLAAPPAGIGGLPQAQGMMPPGMGMPPDQMGAPQPAPAMPQGGIPMPAGMESAPPFSPGAEEAPPTPDGMPPIRANVGMLITPFTRAAQFMGDKAAQYGPAVNQYMGNLMMRAQPTVQRVTGGSPPMPLSVQGREALVQGPAGTIVQGAGTKLAPYTTMGPLMSPTFTEGLKTGLQSAAREYPRVTEALSRMSPALGLGAGSLMALPFMKGASNENMTPEQVASYNDRMAQLAAIDQIPSPSRTQQTPPPVAPAAATTAAEQAAIDERQVAASDKASADPLGLFINEKLKAFDERAAKGKPLSKVERIKASQAEYAPLFEELLGSDKESAKINALLLLSEAGLKLAGSTKPTFAMSVSDAFAGVPRGFAAIAAQEREMGIKTKTAALQQAITDVDAQDRYAEKKQLEVLKGDYKVLEKMAAANKGSVTEDVGIGGRATKDSNGNFLKFSIDGNSDAVKSAINSRYTLRQTDNPYVSNMGEAPTLIVEDKAGRLELGSTLAAHNNSLKSIEIAKNSLSQLYSPGTFFVDKVNNLIVPIDFTGAVRPDLNQEAAKSTLMTLQNTLSKSIASANNSGRTAVQEQEWARQLTAAIANPTAFFKDRELAAKTLTAIETSIRNARQETLTQLGFEGNDYVMRTPNTGTKNDPFPISADPAEQKMMYTFLGSTVGKLQDPKALVHLRMPNGQIQQFTPTQLRAQNQ